MSAADLILATLLLAGALLLLWTVALFADGLRLHVLTLRRDAAARPLQLEVVERDDATPELFRVRLAPRGRRRLPPFEAGQAVLLRTPAGQRLYSLAGWRKRADAWELAIRNQGRVSGWLHAHASVGSCLEVERPRGSFVLASPLAAPIVLVAAGVGITPLRAMLHRLNELDAPPSVTLWHACRHESDLLWRDEFEALAANATWFRYRPVLSRPGEGWRGDRGRVDATRLHPVADGGAHYYLCASLAMMDDLEAGLAQAGVPFPNIHREAFGLAAAADGPQHELVLPDGRTVTATEGLPLLVVLEEHGCAPEAECRTGECGRCLVPMHGQVRYLLEPSFAVPEGEVAVCCATAAGGLEWRT